MMMEAASDRPTEAVDLRWRKQAFNGNRYVFGVWAKTLLATVLLHPSKRAGFFDMARLQGSIDFTRTRADVRWPFAQTTVQRDDNSGSMCRRRPLVESAAVKKSGVPLLESFCSKPLPRIQRRDNGQGMVEDELLPGPIGSTGAGTIICGEVFRELAPVAPSRPGERALFGHGVRTPAEVLINDHLIHQNLWPGVTRELCVFSELISDTTQDDRDLLRVPETVRELGRVGRRRHQLHHCRHESRRSR